SPRRFSPYMVKRPAQSPVGAVVSAVGGNVGGRDALAEIRGWIQRRPREGVGPPNGGGKDPREESREAPETRPRAETTGPGATQRTEPPQQPDAGGRGAVTDTRGRTRAGEERRRGRQRARRRVAGGRRGRRPQRRHPPRPAAHGAGG